MQSISPLVAKAALVREVGKGFTYPEAVARLGYDQTYAERLCNDFGFRCQIIDISCAKGALDRAIERGVWN